MKIHLENHAVNPAGRLARRALFSLFLGAAALAASMSRAQFTNNYQTNTFDGVGSNWAGNYYVGSNNVFDVLQVINGGGLTNAAGSIGWENASSNNLALIAGGGSLWTNTGALTVNRWGVNHQMIVTNGGRVVSAGGSVGNFGRNGTALIGGGGSLWNNVGLLSVADNPGAMGNQLIITNGGQVMSAGGSVAQFGGNSNAVLVSGSGSLWTNSSYLRLGETGSTNQMTVNNGGQVVNAAGVYVGWNGTYNTMTINSSGQVVSAGGSVGYGGPANSNTVLVTGSGSLWTNTAAVTVGSGAVGNQLIISNGGRVASASAFSVGANSGGNDNMVLVDGSNSVLSANVSGVFTYVGSSGSGNRMIITNGGEVDSFHFGIGANAGSTNNTVLVSGSGSLWKLNGFSDSVGVNGSGNQLIINQGGRVQGGGVYVGQGVNGSNNTLMVSDSGSVLDESGVNFYPGYAGSVNQFIITNGGLMNGHTAFLGYLSNANNNAALVTGTGSFWNSQYYIHVGLYGASNQLTIANGGKVYTGTLSNGVNASSVGNTVLVTGGGVLEVNTMAIGAGNGSITNSGGIFSFLNNAPVISPNGGVIVVTNGIIAFRGFSSAPILGGTQLTNLTFQGDNGYMLNSAQNTSIASYTFDSVANTGAATNYQSLWLTGTNSQWNSTALTIGSGGSLVVTGAVGATVSGVVTNRGSISVLNSKVTYQSNVVVAGSYISDPSTNVFSGNLVVSGTGFVSAAAGDVYVLNRDFLLQSSNRAAFNMSQAQVVFTNDGSGVNNHVLNLTNGLAFDLGGNFTNFLDQALVTNFSIGTLTIAPSQNLRVTGVRSGATSNALYIGRLDIGGTTNNLAALLTLDVNVYYDEYNSNNSYLNGLTYGLGSGFLIPIPEPDAALLVTAGALVGLFFRRRKESGPR